MMGSSHPFSVLRKRLRKLTTQNIILLVISFLIALFAWAYIASSIATDYSKSFSNLPVTVDISGTKAEGFGLSVLNTDLDKLTVNATISGNRTNIGGLNKNDLIAYVDFSGVTNTYGKQTFPIRLRAVSGTVLTSYQLSTDSVELTMDRYETRSFPVKAVTNLSVSGDDVIINQEGITCEPAAVAIEGPTTKLSQIDHVSVSVSDSTAIYEEKTFSGLTECTLSDADGNPIADETLSLQTTEFSVTVPVHYIIRKPVTVTLGGVPEGFDTDFVLSRLRISTDQDYTLPDYGDNNLTIIIETDEPTQKEAFKDMDAWSAGSIQLSSLSTNMKPIELTVTLDEGCTDLSNLGTLYVSLDETDLVAAQRLIQNSSIVPINGSSVFDYTVQSGRTSITIVGPTEEVQKVSSDDIQAVVNLYTAGFTDAGTKGVAVSITLPDSVDGVWVSPIPKVNVTASFAEETN